MLRNGGSPRPASCVRPPKLDCTAALFDSPGSDIPPIVTSTASAAQKDLDDLLTKITPSTDWDVRVSGIKRLMGLVNGGVLTFSVFVSGIPGLFDGLASGVHNLRSTLVKFSCLGVAQLAVHLQDRFSGAGDYIPILATQLNHGSKVIADSCKFCVLCIAANCQSRRVLGQLLDLANMKGVPQRMAAAEAIHVVVDTWPVVMVDGSAERLGTIVKKLLRDASGETRAEVRRVMCTMAATIPERCVEIMGGVDEKTRKAMYDEGFVMPDVSVKTVPGSGGRGKSGLSQSLRIPLVVNNKMRGLGSSLGGASTCRVVSPATRETGIRKAEKVSKSMSLSASDADDSDVVVVAAGKRLSADVTPTARRPRWISKLRRDGTGVRDMVDCEMDVRDKSPKSKIGSPVRGSSVRKVRSPKPVIGVEEMKRTMAYDSPRSGKVNRGGTEMTLGELDSDDDNVKSVSSPARKGDDQVPGSPTKRSASTTRLRVRADTVQVEQTASPKRKAKKPGQTPVKQIVNETGEHVDERKTPRKAVKKLDDERVGTDESVDEKGGVKRSVERKKTPVKRVGNPVADGETSIRKVAESLVGEKKELNGSVGDEADRETPQSRKAVEKVEDPLPEKKTPVKRPAKKVDEAVVEQEGPNGKVADRIEESVGEKKKPVTNAEKKIDEEDEGVTQSEKAKVTEKKTAVNLPASKVSAKNKDDPIAEKEMQIEKLAKKGEVCVDGRKTPVKKAEDPVAGKAASARKVVLTKRSTERANEHVTEIVTPVKQSVGRVEEKVDGSSTPRVAGETPSSGANPLKANQPVTPIKSGQKAGAKLAGKAVTPSLREMKRDQLSGYPETPDSTAHLTVARFDPLILVEGKERYFLGCLKKELDAKNEARIGQHINEVVMGVISCCELDFIAGQTLEILCLLLDSFPSDIAAKIADLIPVMFQYANGDVLAITRQYRKIVAKLIDGVERNILIRAMRDDDVYGVAELTFFNELLVQQGDDNIGADELQKILLMSFKRVGVVECEKVATDIIKLIANDKLDAFATFTKSLSVDEARRLHELVTPKVAEEKVPTEMPKKEAATGKRQMPEKEAVADKPQIPEKEAATEKPQMPKKEAATGKPQISKKEAATGKRHMPKKEAVADKPQMPKKEAVAGKRQMPEKEALTGKPQISKKEDVAEKPRVQKKTKVQICGNDAVDWVCAIDEIIESDASEWDNLRPSVYAKFADGLRHEALIREVLTRILFILQERGVADYELLLDGIFLNLRGDSSRLGNAILALLLRHVPLVELIEEISVRFSDLEPAISRNAIDFSALVVRRMPDVDLTPILSVLSKALALALDHDAPKVRKAAVMLFVELRLIVGNAVEPFIAGLSRGQIRLIKIYMERRSI